MAMSEYEAYGVANIKEKHQSRSHIAPRKKNALSPCFVCGADAEEGWSHLGLFIMCSRPHCLNQLHSCGKRLNQQQLAQAWNRLATE